MELNLHPPTLSPLTPIKNLRHVCLSSKAAALAICGAAIFNCGPQLRAFSPPPAAVPVISVPTGSYSAPQTLTITDATPGATIVYTLNGKYPNGSSAQYTGPITVTGSTYVQAIALAPGMSASPAAASMLTYPAAAPVVTPAAGTYSSPQTVTLASATPGAKIWYTVNGRTPNKGSFYYGGPLSLTANETISAIAYASQCDPSTVTSATYVIQQTAAVPTFTPAPGTYPKPQTVSIGTATQGAAIYYTTDGSAPTTSSLMYSAPVPIASNALVKAVAIATGIVPSPIAVASYTISPVTAAPVFSPAAGTYYAAQAIALTDSSPGATIYYTTDGSTPSVNSARYTAPVNITSNKTLRAIATTAGAAVSPVSVAAYALATGDPIISPLPGSYNSVQTITLSDATPGASIYYTTDSSWPSKSSTLYAGPFTAKSSMIVRPFAVGPTGQVSNVPKYVYNIAAVQAAPPVFSPGTGGKVTSIQTVSISDATPGANIFYTINGGTPTAASTPYSGPITVSATQTIQAVAIVPGGTLPPIPSKVTAIYFYVVFPTADPVMTPAGGNFNTFPLITISDSTPNAVIHYTIDGSYPTIASPVYTTPIPCGERINVRAVALAPGSYSQSATVGQFYFVYALPPVITPASGATFVNNATVTMSDATPGAVIYYTSDGTVPTFASPVYTGPIPVTPYLTGVQNFQAMALAPGYIESPISQSLFSVGLPPGILATAQVSTTPVSTIPPDFLGLSQDVNTTHLITGQASTGINYTLRNLLGNIADNLSVALPIRINGDDSSVASLQPDIEPLKELAQAVNVHYYLGVDMFHADPALAQSEAAAWLAGIPSQYIDAFELGNEPDNYLKFGYWPDTYAFPDYAVSVQTWEQGINSLTGGSIPFVAASYASTPFVKQTKAGLAAGVFSPYIVSQHWYLAGYPLPQLSGDVMLQQYSAVHGPTLYDTLTQAVHKAGLRFRMGETNSIWGGGAAGISNNFTTALWSLDVNFEYLNHGLDGVNWQSSNYTYYELFEFRPVVVNGMTTFPLRSVNPLYYGLLAFSQLAGHGAQLLHVNYQTPWNVKVWATIDPASTVHMAVINKDEGGTGTVQISLPGYSTGTVRYLRAPGWASTNHVTLAGQTFDGTPDGTIQGPYVTSTITSINGVFNLTNMPTVAAALIDFTKSGQEELVHAGTASSSPGHKPPKVVVSGTTVTSSIAE